MKKPENAKRVVYGGMSFTVCLFVSFSLLGYLVYGERTQASIPLNLCGTTEATTAYASINSYYYYSYNVIVIL